MFGAMISPPETRQTSVKEILLAGASGNLPDRSKEKKLKNQVLSEYSVLLMDGVHTFKIKAVLKQRCF